MTKGFSVTICDNLERFRVLGHVHRCLAFGLSSDVIL